MTQLVQRLLVFFIGTPLVVSLALFDFYNHLPLLLAIVFITFMASRELYTLLKEKLFMQPRWLFLILIMSTPLVATLVILAKLPPLYIYFAVVIMLMISFTYEIFSPDNENSFYNAIPRFCSSCFGIIYIGLFSTYISQLTLLPNATIFIATFFLMVFGCDSLAWFFGMLFGKGNRGFIKASPNKSLAGFFGGIFGSVFAGMIMYYFSPEVFSFSPILVCLVGILVALTSIVGDLIESVIKRSCAHKDSDIGGVGIPGRGGFLDSIDSILFSAPIFFILATLFFM